MKVWVCLQFRKLNSIYTFFFFFLRYLLPSEVVFSQTWRWNSCSFDDLYMSDIAFCTVIFSLRRLGLLWSHCWAVWKTALALVEELDSQAWTSYSQWNVPGVLQMLPVRTHTHKKKNLSFCKYCDPVPSFAAIQVDWLLGFFLESSHVRKGLAEYNLVAGPHPYWTNVFCCLCLNYSVSLEKISMFLLTILHCFKTASQTIWSYSELRYVTFLISFLF